MKYTMACLSKSAEKHQSPVFTSRKNNPETQCHGAEKISGIVAVLWVIVGSRA